MCMRVEFQPHHSFSVTYLAILLGKSSLLNTLSLNWQECKSTQQQSHSSGARDDDIGVGQCLDSSADRRRLGQGSALTSCKGLDAHNCS